MPAARGVRLLPGVVILPVRPTISPGTAYAALGVSRQVAAIWREREGFPHADARTGFLDTASLAGWLAAHNCRVRWI